MDAATTIQQRQRVRFDVLRRQIFEEMSQTAARWRLAWIVPFNVFTLAVLIARGEPTGRALIQSAGFPESYNGSYGLQWNAGAALASNVDIGVNILESDGTLSDTWRLFGSTGDTRINIPFFSDIEGQTLTPPLSATSIFETGNWQTVANFTLNNGDTFTWQFRSDVPEPAAWALMVVGFAGLGVALRSRRRNIAATA